MGEISKKAHKKMRDALNDYDKGERNIKRLQKVLELIFQEWEYIQNKL